MLTNYYCRDVYYVHHTEEFSGYSLHRLFNNTICLEVSTEKTRSTCTPSPHHTALPFSTHTWANLSINICASAIFLLWPVIQKCGEGGKCRKRKSSAVLLLALDYTISFWFGLEVCEYAFSSIRQLKILRARTIGGPFLHTCIIFRDYVCTHIGSITTTRLIEDDVSC